MSRRRVAAPCRLGSISRLSGPSASARSRPEGAVVVALANSPVNLDPRLGADEVSQKAHQRFGNTLVRMNSDLQVSARAGVGPRER